MNENVEQRKLAWTVAIVAGLALVALAFYYWSYNPPETEIVSPQINDVAAIERELENIDINNIDSELQDIEKELNQ